MPFHRKTTPSYFISSGNLLAGYDYINTPGLHGTLGSGVSVGADGQKSGGPNDGTYFMAFGEDATSTFLNRPSSALADNTDFLDDILNTSIPVHSSLDDTASGAVTGRAIAGDVYVGVSGAPNNANQRNRLVRVTDQDDNDLEVSGSKVLVSLIHDGAGTNVVGTASDGFHTAPVANFSPSIPNGTAYRLHFGIRASYASISGTTKGALFEEGLRTIHNVSGEVRSLLRQIHSEASVNQAWDAAFDSTIRSLASSGLNERYRRATTQPAGFVTGDYDTAGEGAVITRDGRAIEIVAPTPPATFATPWADRTLASLRVSVDEVAINTSTTVPYLSDCDVGLEKETFLFTSFGAGQDTRELIKRRSGGALVRDLWPRESTTDLDGVMTFINSTADATLNPDGGSSADDRRTIQAPTGQRFRTGGATILRPDVDLIEVTFSNGDVRVFKFDEVVSDTRIRVRVQYGPATPDFGTSPITDVRIRILQVGATFGGAVEVGIGGSLQRHSLFVSRPPRIIASGGSIGHPGPAGFYSALNGGVVSGGTLSEASALGWGHIEGGGPLTLGGFLYGDGSIASTALSIPRIDMLAAASTLTMGASAVLTLGANSTLSLGNSTSITAGTSVAATFGANSSITMNADSTITAGRLGYVDPGVTEITVTGTYTVNGATQGSLHQLKVTADSVDLTIAMSAGSYGAGTELIVSLTRTAAASTFTLTWGAPFKFQTGSSTDNDPPSAGSNKTWRFLRINDTMEDGTPEELWVNMGFIEFTV